MSANTPQQFSPNHLQVNDCKVTPKVKLRQPNFEIKTSMDLCNLYVKGIKPGVTSTDLFNLFKPFGRIISARVMEDKNSNCKAGFGFVSFSSSIEAAQAMIEMYTEPQKNDNETKETATPVMTARFHEPRVPRPEHNYSQQLELLSNSSLGAHFYTRQRQKIIPLQPTENNRPLLSTSPGSGNYPVIASAPIYFPVSNNPPTNPPLYFYPSYWTDSQGVMYTGYVNSISPPPPPPTSVTPPYHYYYQHNHTSYNNNNNKKQHLQRHSWGGNNTAENSSSSENTLQKLIELLNRPEYEVASNDKPKLIKKLKKLNQIEQSNCLNNSVYFKKKICDLLNEKQQIDGTNNKKL